jgi:hypothetical protein
VAQLKSVGDNSGHQQVTMKSDSCNDDDNGGDDDKTLQYSPAKHVNGN